MWLIDAGAARSILSFTIYNSFPASVNFCLSSANSGTQKFGFINGVDNVNWPPYRDSKS